MKSFGLGVLLALSTAVFAGESFFLGAEPDPSLIYSEEMFSAFQDANGNLHLVLKEGDVIRFIDLTENGLEKRAIKLTPDGAQNSSEIIWPVGFGQFSGDDLFYISWVRWDDTGYRIGDSGVNVFDLDGLPYSAGNSKIQTYGKQATQLFFYEMFHFRDGISFARLGEVFKEDRVLTPLKVIDQGDEMFLARVPITGIEQKNNADDAFNGEFNRRFVANIPSMQRLFVFNEISQHASVHVYDLWGLSSMPTRDSAMPSLEFRLSSWIATSENSAFSVPRTKNSLLWKRSFSRIVGASGATDSGGTGVIVAYRTPGEKNKEIFSSAPDLRTGGRSAYEKTREILLRNSLTDLRLAFFSISSGPNTARPLRAVKSSSTLSLSGSIYLGSFATGIYVLKVVNGEFQIQVLDPPT
jgi:hypothetical protein